MPLIIENLKRNRNNCLCPFHTPSSKINNGDNISNNIEGENCIVKGKIVDVNNNAISGASIEGWQSGPDGLYDVRKEGNLVDLRGTFMSQHDGS